MKDDELTKQLRDLSAGPSDEMQRIGNKAADRIQELMREHGDLVQAQESLVETLSKSGRARKEAEAKLAKAIDALRLVTDACDEGQMVSLGTSGMTIDAQIRRSVYNKVPAWPIEEARVVLEELDNK